MDALEAIYSRRSIRKFKPDVPEIRLVEEILEAGARAPSGGNCQPWRFIVITDKKTINLVTLFSPGFANHPTKPPLLLAVCSTQEGYGEGQTPRMKAMLDTYLAAENIAIAAVAKGLGTVMVSSFPEKEIKEILEVPENVDLALLIALGYPDIDGNSRATIRKPVESVSYKEKFGKPWG